MKQIKKCVEWLVRVERFRLELDRDNCDKEVDVKRRELLDEVPNTFLDDLKQEGGE